MKAAEIRELTDDELNKQLVDSRRELLNLRIQAKTGQLESGSRIRHVRHDIARILTEAAARTAASTDRGKP